MSQDPETPVVRLRGHHLLCLHGFRGLGYSAEFRSNMCRVRDRLLGSPDILVEVTASPDDICAACPHLSNERCSKRDEDSESRIHAKDAAILSRLSLSPGDRMPAQDLFALTGDRFGEGLDEVCSSCRWFPLGWCADGIRNGAMTAGSSLTQNSDAGTM